MSAKPGDRRAEAVGRIGKLAQDVALPILPRRGGNRVVRVVGRPQREATYTIWNYWARQRISVLLHNYKYTLSL